MDIKSSIDIKINYDDLRNLIKEYKYGRYCEDRSLPIESSRSFLMNLHKQYLLRDDTKCATVFSTSGQLQGVLEFRRSKWDTEHFGYSVAVIDAILIKELNYKQKVVIANSLLGKFFIWCESNSIRFISVRIPYQDLPVIHSLEDHGFHFIESWIYNKFNLNRLSDQEKTCYKVRLSRPNDCDIMIDYSNGAFATQRFHADPNISYQKADSLYKKWILTSFHDPKQYILALDIESKPVAYMIYYKNTKREYFDYKFAMWKMALLDPNCKGKRIGTNFFKAVLAYHKKEGLDIVDSGLSIRNLTSLNLHNKLNFEIITTFVTFHKWL